MKSIWIARDMDGSLYTYQNKPLRMDDFWVCHIEGRLSRFAYQLNPDWFPEVTWESGPIELVIKEKEE